MTQELKAGAPVSGVMRTEDRVQNHTEWPCVPKSHEGISCREAIARWGEEHGKQVILSDDDEETS